VIGAGGRGRRLLHALAVCGVLVLPGVAPNPGQGAEPAYTFGVFPFLSPVHVEQIFSGIVTRLSGSLAHEVRLQSGNSFEEFQAALDAERFDLAFVQPFDYVRFAAKKGYQPLAARSEALAALLVLPEDSTIGSVEDLRGKVVALPPETAAVSFLTRSLLERNGLIPGESVTIRYTRNHETCLSHMLVKTAAACGTAQGPLSVFEGRVRAKTRILATSVRIQGSLVVAHPRLGKRQIELARKGLLEVTPSQLSDAWAPAGRDKLFVPVRDRDYEPVRLIAAQLGVL
jgi:phosphonate transport system substrate-binding protein